MIALVIAVFLPVGVVDRLLVADQLQAAVAAERLGEIILGAFEELVEIGRLIATGCKNKTGEFAGAEFPEAEVFFLERRGKLRLRV